MAWKQQTNGNDFILVQFSEFAEATGQFSHVNFVKTGLLAWPFSHSSVRWSRILKVNGRGSGMVTNCCLGIYWIIVTRTAAMQRRYCDEQSVCPSVCQTRNLRQSERNLRPHSHIIWKFGASSSATQEWLMRDVPRNFVPNWPTPFKNGDFQSILALGASAVIHSEKSSVITNRKTTRGFPVSLT